MRRRGVVALNHYPALWYERRRDDHGRSRRADADVWAPFYEQPFSRSGEGEAFDRLSKYDLDRYNPWYWSRIKQFADIADRDGLLFIEDHYLQHNIIEEGAHWADYPWRQANNINNLGFPENTFYATDKRVFMAEQFYDLTNARLVSYHIKNIRKYLDELADNHNVIHHLGAEYTGPLSFAKFWLKTIGAWEKEKGKDVMVMLSANKDVIDGILADPEVAPLLDIIDIRQWHYRSDGSLYAPKGGVSLAPRQYSRLEDVGIDDMDAAYRAVKEYRLRCPEKVIVYDYGYGVDKTWAAFLAGGSLCNLPKVALKGFYDAALQMQPMDKLCAAKKYCGMGKEGTGYLIYSKPSSISLDLTDDATRYTARWIDPKNGKQVGKTWKVKGGSILNIENAGIEDKLLWLSK
jgi:hypothetical protein